MEFQRIGKNTVQCHMSVEEMQEYGFAIEDFFTDQEKSREFLEQLVERAEEEVGTLMSILRKYLKDCVKKSMKNNVRCRVIGRREELSDDIVESINNLEEKTKNNTGLNFTIAINYGGRDEIVRAVQKIAQDVKEGKIAPEAIDEAMINANLDTKDIPDPDLLIRTSGEQRLSNYLPWQLAYTEFYFTDVFWPDFNREELIKACEKYNKRDRRYGGVKEE